MNGRTLTININLDNESLTVIPTHKDAKSDVVELTEKKNTGGRPHKRGLKNANFTLTMNPETYEKVKIVASEHTRGNVSALFEQSFRLYCKENGISLEKIKVSKENLEKYRKKQGVSSIAK